MATVQEDCKPKPEAPNSICAIRTDKYSYVFYARNNNRIGYLRGPLISTQKEQQGAYQYTAQNVSDGNDVIENHKESSQLSAVAYKDNKGVNQIRIFFVDPKSNLAEMCTNETETGLAVWYPGALSVNGNRRIDPKSILSCSIDREAGGKISVFHQETFQAPLMVAQKPFDTTVPWGFYEVNQLWKP